MPENEGSPPERRKTRTRVKVLAVCVLLLCIFGFWRAVSGIGGVEHVFWSAFWTCIATGLGALPFLCFSKTPGDRLLGLSNGAAAGMMLAASFTLAKEGLDDSGAEGQQGPAGLLVGALLGVCAIICSKPLLDAWGGSERIFRGMEASDAKRVFLLCLVMFAHSAAEGISIGVSYADGGHREHLGRFVALSLAIHNVPEGLVTCLALVPRGVAPLEAALWAIFTSLSQPLMAPLAFWAVQEFKSFLSPGLGFAAGAMTYVACCELLPEAAEQLKDKGGKRLLALVVALAGAAMWGLSELVNDSSAR